MQYVCQYLEKEYSFAVDIANCIHAIEGMATKEGEGNIVVLNERMLLACDVEKVVKNWTQERVESLQEYCRKRWKETNNSHLKVRYGWALWSLTEGDGGQAPVPILKISILQNYSLIAA